LYRYFEFEETVCSEIIGKYISFGIRATDQNGNEILSVSDVSVDKAFVSGLCALCEKLELSPLHLVDVIEDSI